MSASGISVDAAPKPLMISAMRGLSVRQPWAHLIVCGAKNIENRAWQANNPALRFRGRCLIHASKTLEPISDQLRAWVREIAAIDLPMPEEFCLGGVVGEVTVVDVVHESPSPWFKGPVGLVLANPLPRPFHACRGRLGFFEIGEIPKHLEGLGT
jgi:hypothetical protein